MLKISEGEILITVGFLEETDKKKINLTFNISGALFSLKSDSFSKSLCDSERDFDALIKLDESKQFGLIISPIRSLILSLEFSD